EKERLLAVQLITELMKSLSLERNKRYAYVPFAEKYPYIKNGVFKGDEDKPRVKHEGEEYADIYGELTEHLRSQMGATDAWGVPKGYTAEDGLSARDLLEIQRSKAKTINAGVALATPIVFFYDAAVNEEGKVQYLNVQQLLNDKFLGKIVPQEYFAMAEGSSRIEELNYIALDNVVKDCNANPDLRFAVKISCRLLLKQETLTKLVDKMRTENKNLILAFDCAMLEAVGFVGISAINTLKSQGALIMIDNAESASMRVLTEYEFDYLRLDARYYNGGSTKRLAHLDMITGYADVQNIITTSINCEHKEDARILLDHGVKVIQGDAVARPMRLINLALTNLKPIPKVKRNGEN
ncbi:MAG: EAL domain-containing protein, partial [Clostridia bacterium]|nr:EAL domain-containing protein [Clostridia bacterium]